MVSVRLLTAFKKLLESFNAGSVTAGIDAERQLKMEIWFSWNLLMVEAALSVLFWVRLSESAVLSHLGQR